MWGVEGFQFKDLVSVKAQDNFCCGHLHCDSFGKDAEKTVRQVCLLNKIVKIYPERYFSPVILIT